GHAELGEAIQAAGQFAVEHFIGVEVANLARERDLPVGDIKQIDGPDPAAAVDKALPVGFDVVAQGVNRPQAGNDDASGHGVGLCSLLASANRLENEIWYELRQRSRDASLDSIRNECLKATWAVSCCPRFPCP